VLLVSENKSKKAVKISWSARIAKHGSHMKIKMRQTQLRMHFIKKGNFTLPKDKHAHENKGI